VVALALFGQFDFPRRRLLRFLGKGVGQHDQPPCVHEPQQPEGVTVTLSSVASLSYLGAKITKDTTYVYYTAVANKNTQDYFTYTISDGKGGTATGRVNVNAQ
jgi:hypothetical protein